MILIFGINYFVQIDVKESFDYIIKAAERGDDGAMNFYGTELIDGARVRRSVDEGVKYLKKSIEKGNTNAMYTYGMFLYNRDKSTTSKVEAFKKLENGG